MDHLRRPRSVLLRWQGPIREPVENVPATPAVVAPLPDRALFFLRELMQFPVSVPSDGLVDLVIQGTVRICSFLFHLVHA